MKLKPIDVFLIVLAIGLGILGLFLREEVSSNGSSIIYWAMPSWPQIAAQESSHPAGGIERQLASDATSSRAYANNAYVQRIFTEERYILISSSTYKDRIYLSPEDIKASSVAPSLVTGCEVDTIVKVNFSPDFTLDYQSTGDNVIRVGYQGPDSTVIADFPKWVTTKEYLKDDFNPLAGHYQVYCTP